MSQLKNSYEVVLRALAALILFAISSTLSAQKNNQKLAFSSIGEAGLLTGEKGEAFVLHTINGLQKGRSFAGIGVGFDYYGQRTVPLFASYRRTLSTDKNVPFVYANVGLDFLWPDEQQKTELQSPAASTGGYYDLGLGWKFSGRNRSAFIVSAGYNLKQVKYKVPSFSIFAPPQTGGENFERFNFLYRRLVVKIGFQL